MHCASKLPSILRKSVNHQTILPTLTALSVTSPQIKQDPKMDLHLTPFSPLIQIACRKSPQIKDSSLLLSNLVPERQQLGTAFSKQVALIPCSELVLTIHSPKTDVKTQSFLSVSNTEFHFLPCQKHKCMIKQ